MTTRSDSISTNFFDFQTCFVPQSLRRLRDEEVKNSANDIQTLLRLPHKARNGVHQDHEVIAYSEQLDFYFSSMSRSSATGSYSDFDDDCNADNKEQCKDDDIEQSNEFESLERGLSTVGYFIPGITAKAMCLEGAKSIPISSVADSSHSRQRRVGSSTRHCSSTKLESDASSITTGGSSSSSTICTWMSSDVYQSISNNLDVTRDLLKQANVSSMRKDIT